MALLLMAGTAVYAQDQTAAGTGNKLTAKTGIKGGVNLTNLYVDDVQDENMKAGLNIGLFAKFPVTKGFSIQPELLYSSKGSRLSYNNAFGNGAYRFNLNYVEIPVLAVINIGKVFNIHAGGYAGYLASANIKEEDESIENNEVANLNEDDFNRVDYGLVGGVGLDIDNFGIGVRYDKGLNRVSNSSVGNQLLGNSKNSAWTLYVGFAL